MVGVGNEGMGIPDRARRVKKRKKLHASSAESRLRIGDRCYPFPDRWARPRGGRSCVWLRNFGGLEKELVHVLASFRVPRNGKMMEDGTGGDVLQNGLRKLRVFSAGFIFSRKPTTFGSSSPNECWRAPSGMAMTRGERRTRHM
jgi:hypothetical protein